MEKMHSFSQSPNVTGWGKSNEYQNGPTIVPFQTTCEKQCAPTSWTLRNNVQIGIIQEHSNKTGFTYQ